jgi:hypothetical protein
MPQFTSEELRYYVKSTRTAARDLIFHLHDHSRNTLGMTAPVSEEGSRALLNTLQNIDSNIHDGNLTGTLPAIAFLDTLRDNSNDYITQRIDGKNDILILLLFCKHVLIPIIKSFFNLT